MTTTPIISTNVSRQSRIDKKRSNSIQREQANTQTHASHSSNIIISNGSETENDNKRNNYYNENTSKLSHNNSKNKRIEDVTTKSNKIINKKSNTNSINNIKENISNNSSYNHNSECGKRPSCSRNCNKDLKNKSYTLTYGNSKSDSKLSQEQSKSGIIDEGGSIEKEVNIWYRKLPLNPGSNHEDRVTNDRLINALTKNLTEITEESNDLQFDRKVRHEIESCLRNISVWYPGARRDQIIFKNHLIEDLLSRTKRVHTKRIKTTPSKNDYGEVSITNDDVKTVIIDWLSHINIKTKNDNIDKQNEMVDFIINKIEPTLNLCTHNHKLRLKTAIINVLNDLFILFIPIDNNINSSRDRSAHIQKLADDLVDKLLRHKDTAETNSKHVNTDAISIFSNKSDGKDLILTNRRDILFLEVDKYLRDAKINCPYNVKKEIVTELEMFMSSLNAKVETSTRNKIASLLKANSDVTEAQASNAVDEIFQRTKRINGRNLTKVMTSQSSFMPQTQNISIYTSEESCCMNYPMTSIPRKSVNKEITKRNPLELEYIGKVAMLVKAWIDTLPETFSKPEERDFKETIVKDLAEDIMDEAKLEQIAPSTRDDRAKYLRYIVSKWIVKLDVINLDDVAPQIDTLIDKLDEIPMPNLAQRQNKNHPAVGDLKQENKREEIGPVTTELLENEISIWMNQQPSLIFKSNNPCYRHNKIRQLAQILVTKLANNATSTDISNELTNWLNEIVNVEERREVNNLANDLEAIVVKLIQDTTDATSDKKLTEIAEFVEAKVNAPTIINESTKKEVIEQENTMKSLIEKFIEQNYDIDDPMTRSTVNLSLKTHLQKFSALTGDNADSNVITEDNFPSINMIKELEYIKDISDWLKNIPIDASYNKPGNRERIDFVNNLAFNIREIEDQRENDPEALDYNIHMTSIITQFMEQLPISDENRNNKNVTFMVDQLLSKIDAHRQSVINKTTNSTLNSTGVNTDNIGDFIEEFITVNGGDILDEVKLEAWAIRLIREVKKMVHTDPTKGEVYNQLLNVPKPGDETAQLFSRELEYVKEICNWLKNFPLLISNEAEAKKVQMISQLAEKITEVDLKMAINPNNSTIDNEFKEYLSNWILQLPLDTKQEIVIPVLIQQLMNRIGKIKPKTELKDTDTSKDNKATQKSGSKIKKRKSLVKARKSKDNLGKTMTDVIEKWSQSLPVKAEKTDDPAAIKDNISIKLYQKIGELNMDPKVYNNDLLYRDGLNEEVDTILQSIPSNSGLQNNKDNLKNDIVNAVIEIKNNIKDKTAGDAYKLKLESAIAAAIPNPNKTSSYDPLFEIYKDRLASMFILENFDHGNDADKLKYEKMIKKDIDKYFEHASNRNAVPLSKDEIYHELYSALFKVPIPNENSAIEGVEEIKTKCEINAWFEELPLKETNEDSEYLARDKILAALAKKIHEIEKESKPDKKIYKEIIKWFAKMPLISEQETKLDELAQKLQNTLKTTVAQRKCVLDNKGKKDKGKSKSKDVKKRDSAIGASSLSNVRKSRSSISEIKTPKKKPADIVFEIVQTWCDQLPLCAPPGQNVNEIKDNLVTKIIIKISELHMDPAVFNVDALYDKLLEEELDKLLMNTKTCSSFESNKQAKKDQLIQSINSIKPLVKEEIYRYKYREDLGKTYEKLFEKPLNLSDEKQDQLMELKSDIIDNFIQYKFIKNDEESTQSFKNKIHEAVCKFYADFGGDKEKPKNSLLKTNQLLCELAKIPVANEINIKDEIEEIRMKKEINDFFKEVSVTKDVTVAKLHHLKTNLAKNLVEIERCGYNPDNEGKMKLEISKCVKKLNKEVKPETVEAFIQKLKSSEVMRRSSQVKRKVSLRCHENCLNLKKVLETPANETEIKDEVSSNIPSNDAATNSEENDVESKCTQCQVNVLSCNSTTENTPEEFDEESKFRVRNESPKRQCSCRERSFRERQHCCEFPVHKFYRNRNDCNQFWCKMILPNFL